MVYFINKLKWNDTHLYRVNRRKYLIVAGAGLGTLAGCSEGTNDEDTQPTDDSDTEADQQQTDDQEADQQQTDDQPEEEEFEITIVEPTETIPAGETFEVIVETNLPEGDLIDFRLFSGPGNEPFADYYNYAEVGADGVAENALGGDYTAGREGQVARIEIVNVDGESQLPYTPIPPSVAREVTIE